MDMKKGLWLVLFTAIISGFSIFLNSYVVKSFDSSVFTFAKNVVVALLLFTIILAIGQWKKIKELTKKQWLQLSAIGLIGGSIPFLLFFKGLQMTTGTTGAFIHKTLFIFIAVLALLFLKEKLSKGFLIGAVLLLIGNYLFIRPQFTFSTGHILIGIAVVFWAVENVLAKHVVKEVSGSIVGFGRMFFGSLFILIFLFATSKAGIILSMTGIQYLWILITGVLLLLYVITYYNGLQYVKVSTAAAVLTIGSPITTLLTFFFQGKGFTVYEIAGSFCIVLGVVAIIWWAKLASLLTQNVKE
ncbi:DMT family transporter [Candidatus Woesearchaeota archaeon]|nr:MAG: DMT family transporter [Candidatus Woesearchaeota archaeon]